MERRRFVSTSAAAAAAIAARTRAAEPPPNLLVLHCDQLSSWAVSLYAGGLRDVPNYGQILVETPHLDRLGREGAQLTRFCVTSAVCTPSRGCFFTGRYPHAHGAYVNDTPLRADEVTLGHLCRNQGYETGYAGKWHLSGDAKPGFLTPDASWGFDNCRWMFNRGHWKTLTTDPAGQPQVSNAIGDAQTYTADALATHTIEFLRRPRTRPFAYVVSFPDPHTPFTVRTPYDTMFKPADMPLPRTFRPFTQGRVTVDEARLRQWKAAYCGLVKCLDDNVGRILAALTETGQLDRTVVVFTTDHGEYLGEHGRMHKNQWYRTAYEVPFLVRWPGPIRPGTVVDRHVTSVDVLPTLCGLLGLRPSGREQGHDASGLLRGEAVAWQDEAFIHHSSLRSAGLFTPRHELILAAGEPARLYDRREDPEQTVNLADRPEHRETVAALQERIVAHHRAVESPALAWLSAPAGGPALTVPGPDGVVVRQTAVRGDTLTQAPRTEFTRVIATAPGLLAPGREYVVRVKWRSDGLGDDDSAFFLTVRPGTDRAAQIGPLRWQAARGEQGLKEQRFSTGTRGDWNVIVGIFRRGALLVEEFTITQVGEAAAGDDD